MSSTDALLYLPGADLDTMRRLLNVTALSPGWQGSFRDLVDQAGMTGHPRTPRPQWCPAWDRLSAHAGGSAGA